MDVWLDHLPIIVFVPNRIEGKFLRLQFLYKIYIPKTQNSYFESSSYTFYTIVHSTHSAVLQCLRFHTNRSFEPCHRSVFVICSNKTTIVRRPVTTGVWSIFSHGWISEIASLTPSV